MNRTYKISYTKVAKKNYLIIALVSILFAFSCNDFMDVIPDNVPTIDHAFNNRVSAERVLFTCYSYLPDPANPNNCAGLMTGRECWLPMDGLSFMGSTNPPAFNIARGYHSANNPALNYWGGINGGTNLFVAIRDCNLFLENIDRPYDLEEYEKKRWVSEVKFLKAYYHFYLLRMYGPTPIVAENTPVSAGLEEVRAYREPVDEVGNYIVTLLDEAMDDLPLSIQNRTQEMGRITKPIAAALKAKTLMLIASPLFNGNYYYKDIKDNRGVSLFSETEDIRKWEAAAKAVKDAIDCAHEAGHQLYYYRGYNPISDDTKKQLNTRCAVTERWNDEIIWGSTKGDGFLQSIAAVRTNSNQFQSLLFSMMSPTLDVAERFYSNNGVPIEEDKFYDYENRYNIGVVEGKDRYFMKEGFETANLHLNREVRFYASLSFDGSANYGNGSVIDDPGIMSYTEMKRGRAGGMLGQEKYSITGYLPKKLVHLESTVRESNWNTYSYSFPYIRLADLYLMYAEALNEIKSAPDADVFFWIDEVRKRASLDGVQESWTNYSNRPEKIATQSGMRNIIHQERLIEFAFEGPPYWDLLRWKKAEQEMSRPIRGWNAKGSTTLDFYDIKVIAQPSFRIRDYLAPVRLGDLDRNPNLVQNFGWETSN